MMTKSSPSRQARRKLEKDLAQSKKINTTADYVTRDELKLLVQDVQKVLNYAKLVDNHVWMLVDTLDRKGILGWSDVNDTEHLYALRDKNKKEEIKRILSLGLNIPDILDVIKESSDKKGYERLDINPVRDLNVNPYELCAYLKEIFPDLSPEEYLARWKSWGLTPDNFGFKKEIKG